MKPICVPCQRFFRCKKTGYYFIEGMPKDGVRHASPGAEAPEQWTPYKLWVGDLWQCEGCGTEIVSGVGMGPIAEHYMEEFNAPADQLGASQLQVNDC